MKLWRACLFLQRKSPDDASVFRPFIERGYRYTCEEADFGKEGTIASPDDSILIEWSDSYRDGIFVKVKRVKPWRIMFEYCDGAHFINDDRDSVRNCLTALTDDLEELRNEHKTNKRLNVYDRLEGVVLLRL